MAVQPPSKTPGGPVGRRLIPHAIDDIARDQPERVWAMIPAKSGKGWQDITFAMLANGANQMAWFMKEKLDLPFDDSFPTVCYIGKPDFRYHMIEVAAMKTKCKVLFSSHVNALPAHLNLLNKTGCRILMSASGVEVEDILQAHPMKHYIVPDYDDVLEAATVETFPFDKTFEEAQDYPFLILHTSGTTGLPKPITHTHGTITAQDIQAANKPFSPEEAKKRGWQRQLTVDVQGGKLAIPFMHFHVIMSLPMLFLSVFGKTILVQPLRQGVGNIEDLVAAIAISDTAWGSPRTLADLAQREDWVEALSRLDHFFCAGGLLPPSIGDKISTKTKIYNIFGTTEAGGGFLMGLPAREDYGAVLFDPELNGIEWRPEGVDDDGVELFEMVIVRKPELGKTQSVFQVVNFQHETEHPMGDLWAKHPTKQHMWIYKSRTDDLICFADGLKYNATKTQMRFKEHPLIEEALMSGEQHSQTNLLVELSKEGLALVDEGKEKEVHEKVLAFVKEINQGLPNLARIALTHIVIAPRDKSFLRSPKGSIRRPATLELFQAEIDEVYRKYGDVEPVLITRVH